MLFKSKYFSVVNPFSLKDTACVVQSVIKNVDFCTFPVNSFTINLILLTAIVVLLALPTFFLFKSSQGKSAVSKKTEVENIEAEKIEPENIESE